MCFSTEKGLTFSRFALHLAEFGFIKTKECLLVFINVNPLSWCYILNSEEILLHTELCPSQTNILGCGHVCCIIGSRATLYFLVFSPSLDMPAVGDWEIQPSHSGIRSLFSQGDRCVFTKEMTSLPLISKRSVP